VPDILPSHADDLNEVLAETFRLLARGVADRRSAFRTPTIATVGPDGAPRIRTMVSRRFDPAARRLTLHTDRRAAKLSEIDQQPSVAVHVYDARAAVHVRLQATGQDGCSGAAPA
jgi:pyridoxine/pyridoxamine 5'-phosphate oxidase